MKIVATEKGEYVAVDKEEVGRPTIELLPEILQRLIGNIPFRKSMRWMDLDVRFARPVHWLVALYGGAVVPFTYATLQSSNLSSGHRFMMPEPFAVSDAADYEAKCTTHYVMADPVKRKALIEKGILAIAKTVGGSLNVDAALLEEVTCLVEDPTL